MKQTARSERNPADYGYPTPDVEALSTKAIEVTQRLTEHYGEVPFSSKDPMSMLVDIILSHRTRDEQTAAAYDNLLQRFGSWEAARMENSLWLRKRPKKRRCASRIVISLSVPIIFRPRL